jgi:hypothetical protein
MSEDQEKDPWRFYSGEHLWERFVSAIEKKEIAEANMYLYKQLVSYYMERDAMMKKVATVKTETIKDAILSNVSFINDQIEKLLLYLDIKRDDEDVI